MNSTLALQSITQIISFHWRNTSTMATQNPIGTCIYHFAAGSFADVGRLYRVRATYTTFSSSIDPRFLDSTDPVSPSDIHPPIHHVTAKTFVPSLTESELERIDSTMMQSRSWKVPPRERHDAVVAQRPRPKPIHSTWLCGKTADACGNCGKVATTKMPQCSEYVLCP